MKKSLSALFLSCLFALSACGGGSTPVEPTKPTEPTGPSEPSEPTASSEYYDVTVDGESVKFHYQREDNNYDDWDMWLWQTGGEGAGYEFNGRDTFGATLRVALDTWSDVKTKGLGFIIRKGGSSWAAKDCGGSDLFVDFSVLEKDAQNTYHIYMLSGSSKMYIDEDLTCLAAINSAAFYSETHITAYISTAAVEAKIYEGDQLLDARISLYPVRIEIYFKEDKVINYEEDYTVEVKFDEKTTLRSMVSKARLFDDEHLGALYNYDGDLGALYSKESTTFKVWSPLSKKINLCLYEVGTPKSLGGSDEKVAYEMLKGEKGVFSVTVPGDLEGKYYTYEVTNSRFNGVEVVDPYARSAGVNGLRGMIVDFSKTNPDNWEEVTPHAYDRKELTVYETHVADVTSSSTWTGLEENRKLFKGMYQEGTSYTEGGQTVSTGFDHIKELGVNAVQIIPLFDQANDEINMSFNWGYNPLNYNVVEGGYSSNPFDGYVRIREFKELVQAYNKAGINIIMDVVYNHVNGAQGSNFDVLMPEYYFRYVGGDLSNGSGCGNETASDHHMFRKFMVDSIKFWTEEYKLGGYRFDLMGLHDLDTMEELTAEAKKINENIVIYGEPWTGGTTPLSNGAKQSNGNKFVGYGAFNDIMRDALIKGGLKGAPEVGWITNNTTAVSNEDMNAIVDGIKGITASGPKIEDPDKTVNYVTCHDNYTLYDRFLATRRFTEEDVDALEGMNTLANGIVFTSQGISFMLAGEEFLRSKQGNSNSYNASYEVNELDYSLKIKHPHMMEFYQKMIALKQNVDGLHLDKEGIKDLTVRVNDSKSLIEHEVEDSVNGRTYRIFHVNALGCEEEFDLSGYELYYSSAYGLTKELSDKTTLEPYETLVVYESWK